MKQILFSIFKLSVAFLLTLMISLFAVACVNGEEDKKESDSTQVSVTDEPSTGSDTIPGTSHQGPIELPDDVFH